ncbi:hypothetical protein [Frigoriglobus tundricola]|uniref:Uncharacterized protein n=1 Tax=Frigoriglobus tundricola TaxID=2774151 RepID=A0A6M5Z3W4_9BACT|nr:hypothetical protein [Frigoriglobus tundricola]QJW99902.1 hypothetical protein FTUN_7525 [Frigoriglobus tundricola]
MPVLPVSHHTWQVLRAVKRTKRPAVGRALRLDWTRKTKDGSFLTKLVEDGLLVRTTGSAEDPFEATYSLSEQGEHAAEYGECDFASRASGAGAEGKRKAAPPDPRKKKSR